MYNNAVQVISMVLKHEGGYVNHPSDPGGETKYGISKRAYPSMDIASLTEEKAVHIYVSDYWNKIKGDQLPSGVDCVVMDTAVNSGISRATKWLQRMVGATPDGAIGPMTLAAVRDAYEQDPKQLINDYMDYRLGFLEKLKTWDTFGRGWSRRVEETREAALKMVNVDA